MYGIGHKERVAQTEVGQWPGWNMDGRKNKEKVTVTAVGQWLSWNINS